jgi:hypothetical protein
MCSFLCYIFIVISLDIVVTFNYTLFNIENDSPYSLLVVKKIFSAFFLSCVPLALLVAAIFIIIFMKQFRDALFVILVGSKLEANA